MGSKQARILSIQYIVFFLLLSMVSAELDIPVGLTGNGACCIPRFAGDIQDLGTPYANPQDGINYCNQFSADYVATCYENGELVDTSLAESGCCCNNQEFIISESPDQYISRNYCGILKANDEARNNGELGYNYRGEGSCDQICGNAGNFYSVVGIVRDATTNQPLDDIQILTNEAETTQTRSDGTFDFGSRLFEEAIYSLTFSTLPDYNLECTVKIETVNVDGNFLDSNGNIFVPVTLDCVEVEGPIFTCEPQLQVFVESEGDFVNLDLLEDGGWSECEQIGSEFLQSRVIRDNNSCSGSPQGLEYRSTGCENEVVDQACDGTYDLGELCDGGLFLVRGQSKPVESLSCSTIFGDGYTGEVTCNNCIQNYGACQPLCDCESIDQCESAACATQCAQELLCTGCKDALSFIPEGARGGEIFELYGYMETAEERFQEFPIEYHLGTKDVSLHWRFDTTAECGSDLLGYDVQVCSEGDSGSCDTTKPIYTESLTNINQESYRFEDVLEEESSFCYNVIARFGDGRRQAAFEDGNLPCYETGNIMCMSPSTQGRNCQLNEGIVGPAFCELYADTQFTNQEIQYESCNVNEVCVETQYIPGSTLDFESGAACIVQQQCDSCNGMFGLFSSYNLPAINIDGTSNFACEELLFRTEVGFVTPGTDSASLGYGQCYVEESQSLFSFYDSCEHITSCYDYVSQGTCGSDPCFKFSDVETNFDGEIVSINGIGCEWQNYSEEVGVGVCRPVVEELHDCSRCDDNPELGFCNQDLCGLYGNCFYKEEQTPYQEDALAFLEREENPTPACIDIRHMSCALYDTALDCIGQEFDPQDPENYPEVDVLYHAIDVEEDERLNGRVRLGNLFVPTSRIAGNNKRLSTSQDAFEFGVCRWDALSNRCFKDSNDFVGNQIVDDCDENPSVSCFQDNLPPRTTPNLNEQTLGTAFGINEFVHIYGAGELVEMSFLVEDEASTLEDMTTYVSFLSLGCLEANFVPCLENDLNCLGSTSSLEEIERAYSNGCYIYPQHTIEELQSQFENGELSFETGEYQMVYFSQDEARNLEELKSVTVFVDATKPEVLISEIDQEVINPYEDVYVTDVTVSVDVFENSACEMTLYNQQSLSEPIIPGVIEFAITQAQTNEFGDPIPDNFAFTYPQLADGSYNLTIVCTDDLKNFREVSQEIIVDADSSIKVVRPIAQVFTSMNQVELAITTDREATCKFDQTPGEDGRTYASSRFFFDRTGTTEEGRVLHTATVPSQIDVGSGVYLIQASCRFDDGEVTEDLDGDILSFAIDDLSPAGHIFEADEIYTGSTSPWQNSRELEIVCDDARINGETAWSNTGCAVIHTCTSSQVSLAIFNQRNPEEVCSGSNNLYRSFEADGSGTLSTSLDFDKSEYEYVYLHYFFEDNGGSRSEVYTVNIKVRDTDISKPNVVVE